MLIRDDGKSQTDIQFIVCLRPDFLFSTVHDGGTVTHIVIYLLNIQRKCEVVDANWGVTSLKVPSQNNGEGTTQVYYLIMQLVSLWLLVLLAPYSS